MPIPIRSQKRGKQSGGGSCAINLWRKDNGQAIRNELNPIFLFSLPLQDPTYQCQ